jgi:hypothetical protein
MLNEPARLAAWSADVYAKQPVKRPDVLLGPLARGCITLLCGPRGVGKSWLALALAHAAARGGTLGPWRARRSHRALYIDAAGSETILHARLMALGTRPPPSLTLVPGDAQAGGLPDLALESGRTTLDQLTTDADLVVIDGLSAMVRKGRGVGTRWAAVESWLRALRRRHAAVLVVDVQEPKAVADLADIVLKVERPADGVAEGDLRLQAKLVSARTGIAARRFALRLTLRKDGAAWTYVDDVDHRAIMAYRLDCADYSSREIARMLDVSPATAWRLIGRGERLPSHIRDRVDLEVPEEGALQVSVKEARTLLNTPLPNGEREGPDAQRREGEGEQTSDTALSALRAPPHLNPLPVGDHCKSGARGERWCCIAAIVGLQGHRGRRLRSPVELWSDHGRTPCVSASARRRAAG